MVNTAKTRTPKAATAARARAASAKTAPAALDPGRARRAPPASPAQSAPRRRLSAADREQQILAGAVDFFSRRGFEAQTRDLAEELGITHALLYHYFPSKGKLIESVYEHVFAGRWDPRWEQLLDGPLPVEDKLCRFYGEYLAAILTPEWLRILVHSGLTDGLIPARYFDLLRQRLFPRLLGETRRAAGSRSRAAPSQREEALMLGFHGGLVYQLGLLPLVYGQRFRGHGDAAVTASFIRDMVQGYLAQAASVVPASSVRATARAVTRATTTASTGAPTRAPTR